MPDAKSADAVAALQAQLDGFHVEKALAPFAADVVDTEVLFKLVRDDLEVTDGKVSAKDGRSVADLVAGLLKEKSWLAAPPKETAQQADPVAGFPAVDARKLEVLKPYLGQFNDPAKAVQLLAAGMIVDQYGARHRGGMSLGAFVSATLASNPDLAAAPGTPTAGADIIGTLAAHSIAASPPGGSSIAEIAAGLQADYQRRQSFDSTKWLNDQRTRPEREAQAAREAAQKAEADAKEARIQHFANLNAQANARRGA